MWQGIEQTVSTITRGINAHVLIGSQTREADLSFIGLELHPLHVGKVAFKLWIIPAFGWNRVIIVVLPIAVLRTLFAVLPNPVRTIAHPSLAADLAFRIVESHAHHIYYATEIVMTGYSHRTVRKELPVYLIERSMLVFSHQLCLRFLPFETGKSALVNKLGIECLFLLSLFIVVIIELVQTAVASSGSHEPRSIAQRDCLAANLNTQQSAIFLGKAISSSTRLHFYSISLVSISSR